jgi:hypothetical protein
MSNDGLLETYFREVPVAQWVVNQCIVLDWYDGPVSGICRLSLPACCFQFESFADRFPGAGEGHLFRMAQVSNQATDDLLQFLAKNGEADGQSWFPVEPKGSEAAMLLDRHVDPVLKSARPTRLVVSMDYSDCFRLKEVWQVWRKEEGERPIE